MSEEDGFEEDYITEVGVGFLDSFIRRLYSELYQVIREYISNAVDAMASKIWIDCTGPSYDTLIIKDNGAGIKSLDELVQALSLMMSIKKDTSVIKRFPPIGYFGIGFFSGGKICDVIEIKTTAEDSDLFIEAKIPVGEWMKAFESPEARYTSLFKVTRYEKKQTQDIKYKNQHHTTVILHNLDEKIRKIFKVKKTREEFVNRLCRITPVDYSPDMNLTITELNADRLYELEIRDGTTEFKDLLKI